MRRHRWAHLQPADIAAALSAGVQFVQARDAAEVDHRGSVRPTQAHAVSRTRARAVACAAAEL
jgi:hypothetical protein